MEELKGEQGPMGPPGPKGDPGRDGKHGKMVSELHSTSQLCPIKSKKILKVS